MKKAFIIFLLFIFVIPTFAQLGNEDLDQIKELKNSKLYVYIKGPKKNVSAYQPLFKKTGTFAKSNF